MILFIFFREMEKATHLPSEVGYHPCRVSYAVVVCLRSLVLTDFVTVVIRGEGSQLGTESRFLRFLMLAFGNFS